MAAALYEGGQYKRASMAPFVRIASHIRKLGIDYAVGKVLKLCTTPRMCERCVRSHCVALCNSSCRYGQQLEMQAFPLHRAKHHTVSACSDTMSEHSNAIRQCNASVILAETAFKKPPTAC